MAAKRSYSYVAIPTGRLIEEIISSKNLDEMDIINQLGISPLDFYDLLEGDFCLTEDIAVKLGKIFDLDPTILMNFEKIYREDLDKVNQENKVLVPEIA